MFSKDGFTAYNFRGTKKYIYIVKEFFGRQSKVVRIGTGLTLIDIKEERVPSPSL